MKRRALALASALSPQASLVTFDDFFAQDQAQPRAPDALAFGQRTPVKEFEETLQLLGRDSHSFVPYGYPYGCPFLVKRYLDLTRGELERIVDQVE